MADRIHVEVDGIALDVEVARARGMETLELMAAAQRAGSEDISALLELYDHVLGDQKAVIEAALESEDGYADYARYLKVAGDVLNAVSKN